MANGSGDDNREGHDGGFRSICSTIRIVVPPHIDRGVRGPRRSICAYRCEVRFRLQTLPFTSSCSTSGVVGCLPSSAATTVLDLDRRRRPLRPLFPLSSTIPPSSSTIAPVGLVHRARRHHCLPDTFHMRAPRPAKRPWNTPLACLDLPTTWRLVCLPSVTPVTRSSELTRLDGRLAHAACTRRTPHTPLLPQRLLLSYVTYGLLPRRPQPVLILRNVIHRSSPSHMMIFTGPSYCGCLRLPHVYISPVRPLLCAVTCVFCSALTQFTLPACSSSHCAHLPSFYSASYSSSISIFSTHCHLPL
jgi:hypothetical protein